MYYIVVIKKNGINNFLQMRNVANWFFENNKLKVFKSIKTAIKNAVMQLRKRNDADAVYVFSVMEDECVSSSDIEKWIGTKREVYSNSLVNSYIKTNKERLYIYQWREGVEEGLFGLVRDCYGNEGMMAIFTNEDIHGDEYRVKEYFGYNNNNSNGC